MVLWAEHNVPKQMTGWFVIASPSDAERFAAAVTGFPRNVTGATGMGEGLAAALRSLDGKRHPVTAPGGRFSGDGAETPARDYVVMMPQARIMAYSRGVTVNGLAIVGSEPVSSNGTPTMCWSAAAAFSRSPRATATSPRAMRRKLLQEIERTAAGLAELSNPVSPCPLPGGVKGRGCKAGSRGRVRRPWRLSSWSARRLVGSARVLRHGDDRLHGPQHLVRQMAQDLVARCPCP